MLRSKITRLLTKHGIDYEFYNNVLIEFHIEGLYHSIEFSDAYEAVLEVGETARKDVYDLNDDNFKEILLGVIEEGVI